MWYNVYWKDQVVVKILYYYCADEGVHGLLTSLEVNAAMQTEKKAAEKYRQHQITLLQQQVTDLEERRDRLKNVISEQSSNSVCYFVAFFVTYVGWKYWLFISLLRKHILSCYWSDIRCRIVNDIFRPCGRKFTAKFRYFPSVKISLLSCFFQLLPVKKT